MKNIDDCQKRIAETKEIGLKDIFPNVYNKDPSKIIAEIDMELSTIINEVTKEHPTTIFITERRGSNLYQPFLNSLLLKKHNIAYIRNYHDTPLTEIRVAPMEVKKPVIVLTDAIKKGVEIRKIVDTLKSENIEVYKVCCYFVNNDTIEQLQKEYKNISFTWVKSTSTDKEYQQFAEMLIPVHQSRIEAMDTEHPYNLYQFTNALTKKELREKLESLCVGYSQFYEDDWLCAKNMIGFTAEYYTHSSFQSVASLNDQHFLNIERILLRFKYDISNRLLRVMVFCISEISDIYNFNCDGKHLILPLPYIYEYCSDMEEHLVEIDCIRCMDVNLSLNIIDEIDDNISNIFIENGHIFRKTCEYNPFLD